MIPWCFAKHCARGGHWTTSVVEPELWCCQMRVKTEPWVVDNGRFVSSNVVSVFPLCIVFKTWKVLAINEHHMKAVYISLYIYMCVCPLHPMTFYPAPTISTDGLWDHPWTMVHVCSTCIPEVKCRHHWAETWRKMLANATGGLRKHFAQKQFAQNIFWPGRWFQINK